MSQGAKGDGAQPRRKALLVGNSAYVDKAITPLLAPRTDIEKLAALLADPLIGGFDVAPPQLDVNAEDFRLAISSLFRSARKDDLLLLYFAGHGVRDNDGKLYLAVKRTQVELLSATALPAQFILDEMSRSASRSKVLILDCCHAGAVFEDGSLRARSASYDAGLVRASFLPRGTGTYILAASQSGQSAFEGIDPETKTPKSIYTNLIVDAISTGKAAPDRKDITVSDIHDYIRDHRNRDGVETTPELTVFNQGDDLVLCSNPNVRKPLDPQLVRQLASQILAKRSFAIEQLAKVLAGEDAYQAGLVQMAFNGRLNTGNTQGMERDYELRDKLKVALDAYQSGIQQAISAAEKEEHGADGDGETDTAKDGGLGTQQSLMENSEEQAGEKTDTKAVTAKGAVPIYPPPRRSWRNRLGYAMLTLSVLLYFSLVAVNIRDQREDYYLTFGNIIRLAFFTAPELKTLPGPDTRLLLGKWRVLLFAEANCAVAQQYAKDIRKATGRRVDLTRFFTNDPYNLVFDTGDNQALAVQFVADTKSKFSPSNQIYYKFSDIRLMENPGEFADKACKSYDQSTEVDLQFLISKFASSDGVENSNKIVDLYSKTINRSTKNLIVSRILNEISSNYSGTYSPDDIESAIIAARTLSLFRPCFEDPLNRLHMKVATLTIASNSTLSENLQAAKSNVCE